VSQQPDTQPGHYYVSVLDRASNAGHGRHALALGPFTNDHAGALAQVDAVRNYCRLGDPFAWFWAYGTCRLPLAATRPRAS